MKRELFNDNWYYWEEGNAFALVWKMDSSARLLSLPHDAMIEKKRNPKSINSGNTGFYDGAVYNYAKEFTPAEDMKDKTFILHFDGVYMNTFVYVNAQLAGKWNYGYTGFDVKLNDFLNFGQKNEIRVIVRNSGMANSRWYSGGGIYRDVYLFSAGDVYLRPDGCRIHTESIDDGVGLIKVRTSIISRKSVRSDLTLVRRVKDAEGKVIVEEATPVTVYEREERELSTRFAIENANLWSDESPYLYQLETALYEGEKKIDEDSISFGIRTLSVDAVRGLRVNGKTTKLRGACIHHDSGLVGASTYYDFHYRQIKKLKEAGFNAIRMAHHPAAPVLLQACDELGMYVMDECFDMWSRCKTPNDYGLSFDKCWEQDVEAMVRNDYCHPSVIMYSVGNEIPEIGTPRGVQIAMQISEKIRSLDETRITLSSINGIFAVGTDLGDILGDILEPEEKKRMTLPDGNVNDFMATMSHTADVLRHPTVTQRLDAAAAATDILGYNYMTDRYELDMKERPSRVIVGSETYRSAIARNWKYVKENPAIAGDFVWTGWDYLGETGIGIPSYTHAGDGFGTPYPCIMAYTGDIDITGFRKPASYYADIVFGSRKQPYVCVQDPVHYEDPVNKTPWCFTDALENWTYDGMEGKPVHVEVYSAGDEVELTINGNSVGRKPAGESVDYIARFDVDYQPGTIKAISYENGKEIGCFEIKTAGQTSLVSSVEEGITGKVFFINVESRDSEGNLKYEQGTRVTAKVEVGQARLFMGSGNHSPIEGYTHGEAKLYNGRAQVVIVKEAVNDKVVVSVNGQKINL